MYIYNLNRWHRYRRQADHYISFYFIFRFNSLLFIQESVYNTIVNGLNANATIILFLIRVQCTLNANLLHNICAKLFVSSIYIALVKHLQTKYSIYVATTYL